MVLLSFLTGTVTGCFCTGQAINRVADHALARNAPDSCSFDRCAAAGGRQGLLRTNTEWGSTMKKLVALCIAARGAALLVLGTARGASASPDLSCKLDVNRSTLHPGNPFTAVGTVTGGDTGKPVTWT